NVMEEAEASWKAVLKRETIASLSADFFKEGYDDKITSLENWIQEKMVL
ncbi:transcriptional regulator, partial [Paenibacillus sp. OT2-17]|nr:transcriptional regulator [Paenibacillus sp. OT2-17]